MKMTGLVLMLGQYAGGAVALATGLPESVMNYLFPEPSGFVKQEFTASRFREANR